jgi:hypothetical protein
MRGVVERQVHDGGVVLIDVNGEAMRFRIGGDGAVHGEQPQRESNDGATQQSWHDFPSNGHRRMMAAIVDRDYPALV